ncbi:uclacyanin-2-like [Chenopodium quinoa]|uniref:uclacyanin-2-like n=1 Tax=Chenopodium quinoa TaxID=63459 RepID=UPI000B7722C1|nr:uclacyanin-2-like [Chenopodium quinoa]
MAFAAVFLVILMATPAAFATDYPVTWSLGTDYSSWTTKSLNAGDTLTFTYDGTHNVEEVSKSAYDSCSSSNALERHTGGKTTITLKEGPAYFICGTAGHCSGGMKLQVTAKASGGSTTPSSTPTPSGSTTPSSSTPAGSNGAAGLSSVAPLIIGLPLALVAFFG